jgi:hypothetical protein
METFDPYYKWLGISPEEQPPNHYRLLGTRVFEPDRDVIYNAADRRMGHVKAHAVGAHLHASQKLLNELAVARVCLLSPDRKAEYDARLAATEIATNVIAYGRHVGKADDELLPIFQAERDERFESGDLFEPRSSRISTQYRGNNPTVGIIVVAIVVALCGWFFLAQPHSQQVAAEEQKNRDNTSSSEHDPSGFKKVDAPNRSLPFGLPGEPVEEKATRFAHRPIDFTQSSKWIGVGVHTKGSAVAKEFQTLELDVLAADDRRISAKGRWIAYAELTTGHGEFTMSAVVTGEKVESADNKTNPAKGYGSFHEGGFLWQWENSDSAGENWYLPASVFQEAHLPGTYKITSSYGQACEIELLADGTAKQVKPTSRRGAWVGTNGRVLIAWIDGWREMLSGGPANLKRNAYGPGVSLMDPPTESGQAIKLPTPAEKTSSAASVEFVFLTDLKPAALKHGPWKIEKRPQPNHPNSLVMHPPSKGDASATYPLNRQFNQFAAEAVLTKDAYRPVRFTVLGNGKPLWESDWIKKANVVQSCKISVSNIDTIELRVSCTGDSYQAHAFWLDPGVTGSDEAKSVATGSKPTEFQIGTNPEQSPESQTTILRDVPDAASVRQAKTKVTELARDLPKNATAADRVAFGQKLLALAVESKDDPAAEFALLDEARSQAAAAYDFTLAMHVSNRLADAYRIDVHAEKAAALELIWTQVRKGVGSQLLFARFASVALTACNQAIEDDQFEQAQRMAKLALAAAEKSTSRTWVAKATETTERIKKLESAYSDYRAGVQLLKQQPDHAEGNRVVGKYLCLMQHRWKDGLPHLAKCDVEQIRDVATLDLTAPSNAQDQLRCGDQWWNLALNGEDESQRSLKLRAVHWYQTTITNLKGLDRARIENRIAEAASDKPTQVIDLMETARLTKASPDGRLIGDGRTFKFSGELAKVLLPTVLPQEYELCMELRRPKREDGHLSIHLLHEKVTIFVVIDGIQPKGRHCRVFVGDKMQHLDAEICRDDKWNDIRVVVRRNSVSVYADGNGILTFATPNDLTPTPTHEGAFAHRVDLLASKATYEVRGLRIVPLK